MTPIASDLLQLATLESRIAFALHVESGCDNGETWSDRWRNTYVPGFLAGYAARSMAELQADLSTLAKEAPHALHRSGTDPAPPARRKSDAEDAALAADVEAEARRARDRDRAQRQAAHQHSNEVKP